MKEKWIAWMDSREPNAHVIRLLVCGYIVYMGVQVAADGIRGNVTDWLLLLCAALMLLAGIPLALISLYAVYRGYRKLMSSQKPPENEPLEDETPED